MSDRDRAKRVGHFLSALNGLLVFKGAVSGAFAVLALFGVTVPWLGIEPTPAGEGVAAIAGAVLGVLVALTGRA